MYEVCLSVYVGMWGICERVFCVICSTFLNRVYPAEITWVFFVCVIGTYSKSNQIRHFL